MNNKLKYWVKESLQREESDRSVTHNYKMCKYAVI